MDEVRMDRRKFLGGAAGVGAAAALASWAPGALSKPGGPKAPIVFKDTLVCQHFSVRDATARLDKSVMGYLGGPNYPEDPTDLGPLVPEDRPLLLPETLVLDLPQLSGEELGEAGVHAPSWEGF